MLYENAVTDGNTIIFSGAVKRKYISTLKTVSLNKISKYIKGIKIRRYKIRCGIEFDQQL